MISIAISAVIFAPVVVLAALFVINYRAATGTWYQRAWAGTYQSATIAWAKIVIFSDAILSLIDKVAPALGSPTDTVAPLNGIAPQQVIAAAITGIMVITIVARARSILKQA